MGLAYKPELDGLRAIAVLLVVACHAQVGLDGGGRGVDVFFVLSGFLITRIITAELEAGAFIRSAFWMRRLRRLMPALTLMVAAYVLLSPFLLPQFAARRWWDAAGALLYVNDYLGPLVPKSPLGVTWSLAIEEQFYLLWPFALPLLIRTGHPGKILVLLWFVATLIRPAVMLVTMSDAWAYTPLHVHCSGLLLGGALAFAPRIPRLGWLGLALIGLALLGRNGNDVVVWSITAAEVGTALVIGHILQPSLLSAVLSWEPLRRLGILSYGIYLWHAPVLAVLGEGWPSFFLGGMISVLLAGLSYVTIEALARRITIPRPATA